MEDNSAQKRVKADGQKGGRLSRLNPKTLINPSLRHAPQLDHAYERAAISANLSQEEKGLLDALDLARWLYVSPEKKSTRAGLFWGAIQWLASERASTKGADRDDEALLQLEIIRKELPIKQISQSTLKAYEDSLRAMYYWSQSKRAPDAESIAFVDTLAAAEDMLAREDLSARAKWNYRSALLWHLDQGGEGNERNERARALLNEPESKPEKGKRKQGAVISETDLLKILSFLEGKVATERKDKGVSTAAMTIIWIHAGLATGLRPAEWLDAKWAGKEKIRSRNHLGKNKSRKGGVLARD